MALFARQSVSLKNGEVVTLRMVTPGEAEALLTTFIETVESSPYVLSTLESARLKTIEAQTAWITASNDDPRSFLIVAEHNDKIVAITNSTAFKDIKRRHRAGLGMSVTKEYRGQGLGEALLRRLIELARAVPDLQYLELNVMGPNVAAYNLYKKYQFKECGRLERAYRQPSGEYVDDISMTLSLT